MHGFFKEGRKVSQEESNQSILFQGQKTEDIKFLQDGSIHIFLSREPLSENSLENLLHNSYKILTTDANQSFVGFVDSFAQEVNRISQEPKNKLLLEGVNN